MKLEVCDDKTANEISAIVSELRDMLDNKPAEVVLNSILSLMCYALVQCNDETIDLFKEHIKMVFEVVPFLKSGQFETIDETIEYLLNKYNKQ
jgi:hypothetical protein